MDENNQAGENGKQDGLWFLDDKEHTFKAVGKVSRMAGSHDQVRFKGSCQLEDVPNLELKMDGMATIGLTASLANKTETITGADRVASTPVKQAATGKETDGLTNNRTQAEREKVDNEAEETVESGFESVTASDAGDGDILEEEQTDGQEEAPADDESQPILPAADRVSVQTGPSQTANNLTKTYSDANGEEENVVEETIESTLESVTTSNASNPEDTSEDQSAGPEIAVQDEAEPGSQPVTSAPDPSSVPSDGTVVSSMKTCSEAGSLDPRMAQKANEDESTKASKDIGVNQRGQGQDGSGFSQTADILTKTQSDAGHQDNEGEDKVVEENIESTLVSVTTSDASTPEHKSADQSAGPEIALQDEAEPGSQPVTSAPDLSSVPKNGIAVRSMKTCSEADVRMVQKAKEDEFMKASKDIGVDQRGEAAPSGTKEPASSMIKEEKSSSVKEAPSPLGNVEENIDSLHGNRSPSAESEGEESQPKDEGVPGPSQRPKSRVDFKKSYVSSQTGTGSTSSGSWIESPVWSGSVSDSSQASQASDLDLAFPIDVVRGDLKEKAQGEFRIQEDAAVYASAVAQVLTTNVFGLIDAQPGGVINSDDLLAAMFETNEEIRQLVKNVIVSEETL